MAVFSVPGSAPEGTQPLPVWMQVEGRYRSAGSFLHSIGDGVLSRGEGAIRPFLASPKISISILKRLPSSTTGARHL